MIIIINGPFGVGKTAVANELQRRVQNCMLYDPEEVGFMLRSMIPQDIKEPAEATGDFQDMELWRILTAVVAEEVKRKYRRTLIVPMTICNREYLSYIRDRFAQIDTTFHYCLLARKEIIHQRLAERGDAVGSWPFLQTDRCLRSFSGSDFEEYIDSEGIDVAGICDLMMSRIAAQGELQSRGE